MIIRAPVLRAFGVFAALSIAVGACGSAASPTPVASTTPAASETPATSAAASPSQGKALTIAYIQTDSFDYYQRGADGAQMAASKLGVTLLVSNSGGKPEKELANVEDAISKKVDGIILFSVGKASETAALAKAQAAGIPVAVLYGYSADVEAQGAVFVQADTNKSGTLAGDWVAKNVASGKVAVIQGLLGRGDAEAYTASFKLGIAANSNLTLVGEPAADWARDKALAAMQNLLTANPGLAAVFVQNEDMALGAVQAIKAAGAKTIVVSQNGSPDGITAIEAGSIAATVAWSPAEEAQLALARLVQAIHGTPPSPKLCSTPLVVVTKANINDAPPWVPSDASTTAALTASCGG